MLIDAHAHLDRYAESLAPALEEIERHRIVTLSNAMDLPSYSRVQEIAARCRLVIPAFGVHPWNAPQYADRLDELRHTVRECVMVGEIGLDYHWVKDAAAYPAQRRVFEFFLRVAAEDHKAVSLHTKGAEEEVERLVLQYGIDRAIVHWYSGPLDTFRRLVEAGAYFTVGVEVMYSAHIREIARELPAELLLTETDNPGGLKWLQGRAGMPSALLDVVAALAELRQTTAQNIEEMVEANFRRLISEDVLLSAAFDRAVQP